MKNKVFDKNTSGPVAEQNRSQNDMVLKRKQLKNSLFGRDGAIAHPIVDAASETTLYIYDEISPWGISAEKFVKEVHALKGKDINIRINSPGGSVFDGVAIYNAIKQHSAKAVVHIDGLAASIAGIIALAGSEIRMAKGAFMMIHEPWSMMVGSAGDMRKEAELLDKVGDTIAGVISDKTKQDSEAVREMMLEETWMNSDEALSHGFIDSVNEDPQAKQPTNLFDLSIFNRVPGDLAGKQAPTVRECEKALRDIGCSQEHAKEILAKGFAGQRQREVVEESAPPQREVVVAVENGKPKSNDRVTKLLIKGERFAPSTKQTEKGI
jgi:ATP-dependent Clp endopeptidase proteolytic subunit ClpP